MIDFIFNNVLTREQVLDTIHVLSNCINICINEENICIEYLLGNFKTKVMIDINHSNCKEIAFILSKLTENNVIISGNSINPYEWLLINPEGDCRSVYEIPSDNPMYFNVYY